MANPALGAYQDGLGSTTGLTDDSAAMTATYQYDAFSTFKTHSGTSGNAWRLSGCMGGAPQTPQLQTPAV